MTLLSSTFPKKRSVALFAALAAACAAACADSVTTGGDPGAGTSSSSPEPSPDAGIVAVADAAAAAAPADPFAAQPDESEGLTNVSADLSALLENGALAGACDRYAANKSDRKAMLLCGKYMFFYDPLGTTGVPAALVKFLAQNFPDELGIGFTKLGLTLDPQSADQLPLGLAPTTPISGNIDAVAFTCASCHFSRLPDGRYAVGAANHDYDYATHILTITLAPTIGLDQAKPSDHSAAAVAKVQPVLDKLSSSVALKAKFGLAMLPLASIKQPALTPEIEDQYAAWPTGTLDFVIAPLPIDDGVDVVGKMIGLWGIPRNTEVTKSGMSNAMLGWTGDTHSLEEFLKGFAILGGVDAPTDDRILPLAEYVYSLRAPANPTPQDSTKASRGKDVFTSAGCAACHDGPRGSGKNVFTMAQIGTDPTLEKWLDPTLSGTACCGIQITPGTLTHGVKSPRLVGLWAEKRFLHDGTLSSLDQLLCVSPRPAAGTEPLRTDGHAYGCDLKSDDKAALEAFLLSH